MKEIYIKYRAWLIWILAAGFFFSEYFARVAPSVMVTDLMQALKVNAFGIGALSAFFYYAYVAMQLPVGALVDRFGPHRLLTVTAALCGLSAVIFAHSNYLISAEFARLLMGFSAAFAFVGALKLASVWFPAHRFGFFAGATQGLGMLGAAVGEGPVSVMVKHLGWRMTMQWIGAVLLVIAILIAIVVRDRPNNFIEKKKQPPKHSLLKSLIIVLKNPKTWTNGVFVGFLFAPTAAFAELWGATYLHNVYHISNEVAASAVSLIFIGWAISSPLVGWFSDHIKRRKPVMIASAFLSLITMSCVLYLPALPVVGLFILLFLYGCSNVGVATSYAVACEINPREVAGTSMSFANMASVLIGASFQPIIGKILDLQWNGKMVHGAHVYSVHDYRIAMLALPLCFVISFVVACFFREPRHSQQMT